METWLKSPEIIIRAHLCTEAALLHLAQCLESVQGTTRSQDYQGILEQTGLFSVRKLDLSHRSWVLMTQKAKLTTKHWSLKRPSLT